MNKNLGLEQSIHDSCYGEEGAKSVLICKDVFKDYKVGNTTIRVLRGVSFFAKQGKLSVIRGRSGSGKSTLVHILGGIEAPDAGEVLWQQKSIYSMCPNSLALWRAKTIGFVFQSYYLLPELSVLENVILPAKIVKSDLHTAKKRALQLLDSVGLSSRVNHRPTELSGGERQRAAIARALINSPEIILADEPTGNLDSDSARCVLDLFLDLQRSWKLTSVIVTHDEKITTYADESYLLDEGKLKKF